MITPSNWKLPEAISKRLGQNTYGRQRTIFEEGQLLIVLHKPPGPDQAFREGVLFWRNAEGTWHCSAGGPGMGALKNHVQTYAELDARLTRDYEHASTAQQLFDLVEALTPLTRAARNMHDTLQAAREAVKEDIGLIDARDLAYEVDRNMDLLLQDCRNAIDFMTARESAEQARLSKEALHASHRLNILAALFLPLTALTSLFGMNFSHGLNEKSPVLFWTVFACGVGLGLVMKGWVLAKPPAKGA
jgi:hypothetical protein